MKTKRKNQVSELTIKWLEATVDAAQGIQGRFNQGVWVRGTRNGRHAEICFACLAIKTAKRLSWGHNTLDDIKGIINELKEDRS
jgi:hypothetical protein